MNIYLSLSVAEAGIFLKNHVNDMTVDATTPCGVKPTTAIYFIVWDKWTPIIHFEANNIVILRNNLIAIACLCFLKQKLAHVDKIIKKPNPFWKQSLNMKLFVQAV